MQGRGQRAPVGILFDSNFARIDDILALALLYGTGAKKEARVVSVSVTGANLNTAMFCDALGQFLAGPINDNYDLNAFGRTLPVGLAESPKSPPNRMALAALSRQDEKGQPLYPHSVRRTGDTALVPTMMRNALTSQVDQNAVVALAGPATSLCGLLDLPGSKELIASKVRFLALSLTEAHIRADVAAAHKLFAEWPTSIVAAPPAIGEALLYPSDSIEEDFAWAPNHPVVDAYRAAKEMPYNAPTWDVITALYSARPAAAYFKLSEPGVIRISESGTDFEAAVTGKHRKLSIDPDQAGVVIQAFRDLVAEKPAQRPSRGGDTQQVQKQKQP